MDENGISITVAKKGYIIKSGEDLYATGNKQDLIKIIRDLIEEEPEEKTDQKPKKRKL